jgi:ankyrin repeat protein
MTESKEYDLRPYPTTYDTPRDEGDVLIGEDTARELMEASSSGNNAVVQSLLSQPEWTERMFEKHYRIFKDPYEAPDLKSAKPISNLDWAAEIAAMNGHAAVVSTILAFAMGQGIEVSSVFHKIIFLRLIKNDHAAVIRMIASADPTITRMTLGHGGQVAIYEAVRMRKTEVVAALLECGADPSRPFDDRSMPGNMLSLMYRAVISGIPPIMEMLLEHGAPIAGTGALHTAASVTYNRLEFMRLLIQHGADVNEVYHGNTPMHYAASKGKLDAMELLEQNGARSDLKDRDGKTVAQLLEEHRAAEEQRAAEEHRATEEHHAAEN